MGEGSNRKAVRQSLLIERGETYGLKVIEQALDFKGNSVYRTVMTEKSSLISKPFAYFAICFAIFCGWYFTDYFFEISEKVSSSILQFVLLVFPLIIVPRILMHFDSGLRKADENGEGAGKVVYLTLGAWIGALICVETLSGYF